MQQGFSAPFSPQLQDVNDDTATASKQKLQTADQFVYRSFAGKVSAEKDSHVALSGSDSNKKEEMRQCRL